MGKTIDHRPFFSRYRTGSAPCLQLSAWSDSVTQLLCRSLTEMKRKILEREVYTEKEKSVASRWIRGRGLSVLSVPLQRKGVARCSWHSPLVCVWLCIFWGIVLCIWCNRSINNSTAVSGSSAAAPVLQRMQHQDTLEWTERERVEDAGRVEFLVSLGREQMLTKVKLYESLLD